MNRIAPQPTTMALGWSAAAVSGYVAHDSFVAAVAQRPRPISGTLAATPYAGAPTPMSGQWIDPRVSDPWTPPSAPHQSAPPPPPSQAIAAGAQLRLPKAEMPWTKEQKLTIGAAAGGLGGLGVALIYAGHSHFPFVPVILQAVGGIAVGAAGGALLTSGTVPKQTVKGFGFTYIAEQPT